MLEAVHRVTAQERGDRHLQGRGDLAENLDRRHAARGFDLREHRARHAGQPRERIERQLPLGTQAREIHADDVLERVERSGRPRAGGVAGLERRHVAHQRQGCRHSMTSGPRCGPAMG
jgi:hypothetical protein